VDLIEEVLEGLWKLCLQGKVFKKRRFLEEKKTETAALTVFG